jgi:hypothetical protein
MGGASSRLELSRRWSLTPVRRVGSKRRIMRPKPTWEPRGGPRDERQWPRCELRVGCGYLAAGHPVRRTLQRRGHLAIGHLVLRTRPPCGHLASGHCVRRTRPPCGHLASGHPVRRTRPRCGHLACLRSASSCESRRTRRRIDRLLPQLLVTLRLSRWFPTLRAPSTLVLSMRDSAVREFLTRRSAPSRDRSSSGSAWAHGSKSSSGEGRTLIFAPRR